MQTSSIPVITIDGPGGSGKGTLSRLIARKLHWHFLESGALYRVLALACESRKMNLDTMNVSEDIERLIELAQNLNVEFKEDPITSESLIILDNQEVNQKIRTELCGEMASKLAVIPSVRAALLERQRAFLLSPGLIADGRDMGTVVFPNANLKIFLEASLKERAQRRYKELQKKDLNVSLEAVFSIIEQRDKRDRMRSISPLVPASDATLIDTTKMDIYQVFDLVMTMIKAKGLLNT